MSAIMWAYLKTGDYDNEIGERLMDPDIWDILADNLSKFYRAGRESQKSTIIDGQYQVCNTCHKQKTLSEFSYKSNRASGYNGSCKECENIKKKEYRARIKGGDTNEQAKTKET